MRKRISLFAVTLALFGAFAVPTFSQKEYTLRIDVRAADGGSVAGTKIRIASQTTGSTIFDVRVAEVIYTRSTEAFFTLDGIGFALIFLSPGNYKAYVENKFYKKKEVYISVPEQGQENQMTQGTSVTLEKDLKQVSRRLTVTVVGETRDNSGRTKTTPVPNAKVEVFSQETEWLYRGKTDASGVAIFDKPFVIGTEVKITATADGWDGQERSVIIGSWQEVDPGNRLTTTSDQAMLKLYKKVEQPKYLLAVQVVNAKTGAPIPGANVEIELIELAGMPFASGTTNLQGQTRSFEVPPLGRQPDSQKHAEMRIKVKARGYKDKWSDIPYEIPYLSTTGRNYLVHLDPDPKAENTQNQGSGQNPYNLPPQFKNRTVIRVEPLDPVLECWAAGADQPCYQPNLEAQVIVYHFAGGGSYWDRRDYDAKRKQQADAGMVFKWACGKSLWRNGRCG